MENYTECKHSKGDHHEDCDFKKIDQIGLCETGPFKQGFFKKYNCNPIKGLNQRTDDLFESLARMSKERIERGENEIERVNPSVNALIDHYKINMTAIGEEREEGLKALRHFLLVLLSIPYDTVVPKLACEGNTIVTTTNMNITNWCINESSYVRLVNRMYGKNVRSAKNIFTYVFLNGSFETSDDSRSLFASAVTGIICIKCKMDNEGDYCKCGRFQKIIDLIFTDEWVRKCYIGLNFIGTDSFLPPLADEGIKTEERSGGTGKTVDWVISIMHMILLTQCVLFCRQGITLNVELMKRMPDVSNIREVTDLMLDVNWLHQTDYSEYIKMIPKTIQIQCNHLVAMFAAKNEWFLIKSTGITIGKFHPYRWLACVSHMTNLKQKTRSTRIFLPSSFIRDYISRKGLYCGDKKTAEYHLEMENESYNEFSSDETFRSFLEKHFFKDIVLTVSTTVKKPIDSIQNLQLKGNHHLHSYVNHVENDNIINVACYLHIDPPNNEKKRNLIKQLFEDGLLKKGGRTESSAIVTIKPNVTSIVTDSSVGDDNTSDASAADDYCASDIDRIGDDSESGEETTPGSANQGATGSKNSIGNHIDVICISDDEINDNADHGGSDNDDDDNDDEDGTNAIENGNDDGDDNSDSDDDDSDSDNDDDSDSDSDDDSDSEDVSDSASDNDSDIDKDGDHADDKYENNETDNIVSNGITIADSMEEKKDHMDIEPDETGSPHQNNIFIPPPVISGDTAMVDSDIQQDDVQTDAPKDKPDDVADCQTIASLNSAEPKNGDDPEKKQDDVVAPDSETQADLANHIIVDNVIQQDAIIPTESIGSRVDSPENKQDVDVMGSGTEMTNNVLQQPVSAPLNFTEPKKDDAPAKKQDDVVVHDSETQADLASRMAAIEAGITEWAEKHSASYTEELLEKQKSDDFDALDFYLEYLSSLAVLPLPNLDPFAKDK